MNTTDKTKKTHPIKTPTTKTTILRTLPLILLATLTLTACTSPDTPQTQTITLNPDPTTTTTTQITEGQLEYYTERYLAPHERLKRRQDRLNTLTQN